MIFLIASNLLLNEAIASDTFNPIKFPTIQILTSSVKVELPLPVETERQKFIINVSSENGFICHNFLREREIKDKLFALQTKADTIPALETKVLETPANVSMISPSTYYSASAGAALGFIMGFFILRK